jgi:hypothetical protein
VVKRGRPAKLSDADKFEIWECRRKVGISVERLCSMWGLGRRRMQEILAEQRAKFGVEDMPQHKRHLVRAKDVRKVESLPSALERT